MTGGEGKGIPLCPVFKEFSTCWSLELEEAFLRSPGIGAHRKRRRGEEGARGTRRRGGGDRR